MRLKGVLVSTALIGSALFASQAEAVTFNLVDTGGTAVGTQARRGFDTAAYYWSTVLTDNITINLSIGFQSLGSNILGQTGSSYTTQRMGGVYDALTADRSSSVDIAAVAGLKTLTGTGNNRALTFTANALGSVAGEYSSRGTRVDSDGGINNRFLAVTNANAKALGFAGNYTGTAYAASDASITFSSDFAFDFDPTDGIGTGQSDFIGVAIHEIGHALGFVSGADDYDYYTYDIATGTRAGPLEGYAVGSVLDLYRYSAPGVVNWAANTSAKYFSLDGGQTAWNGNSYFSTGVYNGDGNQASHWKEPADQSTRESSCSNFVGIMNPYACSGYVDSITANDLAAMDAIGWNLAVNVNANRNYNYTTAQVYASYAAVAPVPEPATWAMMAGGFALVGGAVRRRRAGAAAVAA